MEVTDLPDPADAVVVPTLHADQVQSWANSGLRQLPPQGDIDAILAIPLTQLIGGQVVTMHQ
eukprot:9045816-Prorocentrum_lima.AAC.1